MLFNKEFDVYVAGVLPSIIDEKTVYINNNGDIQFKIKPISWLPKSITDCYKQYRELYDFRNDLVFYGYDRYLSAWRVSSNTQNEVQRVENFVKYFENKIIIFKPYLKKNGEKIYFIMSQETTPIIVDKPKNIGHNLIPIPILDDISTVEIEKRLMNNQAIPLTGYDDIDETLPLIYNNGFLYGEFEEHKKTYNSCIFNARDKIKKVPFDLSSCEQDNYCIRLGKKYIFMDCDYINNIVILEWFESRGIEIGNEDNCITNLATISKAAVTDNVEKEIEEIDCIIDENLPFTEEEFIEYFKYIVKSNNMIYDEKDLINFHISMKTKSLVILSGISGTGKSKLVKLYAQALGINENSQLRMISVKPNWNDDSDLIGFLDIANNIYRPAETGLVGTMLRAEKQADELFIVCFDEMNLARVEYYFSQFLSKLEMEGIQKCINLYDKDMSLTLYNGEKYPFEIQIGDNIFFVGTINTDETTHSFSDKVLDRANMVNTKILPFRDWQSSIKSDKRPSRSLSIKAKDYNSWICQGNIHILLERELEFFEKMHTMLIETECRKGIGYRIITHISKYIANIPQYLLTENKKGVGFDRGYALDIQVAQRIFPKVRGSLEELKELIGLPNNKGLLFNLLDEYKDLSSFEIARALLMNKAKELEVHGYTS